MKKFTLLLLFISGSLLAISQSFSLTDAEGSALEHDELIVSFGEPSILEMKIYIFATNNATEAKQLCVKKEELQILPGTENTFCFNGLCFPPFVYEAPDNYLFTLEPGATTSGDDFYTQYTPWGQQGITIIRYTFFDFDNPDDSVSVRVQYETGFVGVNELLASGQSFISQPFPNPASSIASFVLSLPSQQGQFALSIRNMLGAEVMKYTLSGAKGKVTIPVSSLNEGIYFYSLLSENGESLQTGKMIVRR